MLVVFYVNVSNFKAIIGQFFYNYNLILFNYKCISNIASIEGPTNCTEGDVRLYGGSKPNEGILHFCWNRAWVTVCANSYHSGMGMSVACYQLGYSAYGE